MQVWSPAAHTGVKCRDGAEQRGGCGCTVDVAASTQPEDPSLESFSLPLTVKLQLMQGQGTGTA